MQRSEALAVWSGVDCIIYLTKAEIRHSFNVGDAVTLCYSIYWSGVGGLTWRYALYGPPGGRHDHALARL